MTLVEKKESVYSLLEEKERNKKYNAQRSKEEMNLPLTAINKDLMSLASGVAESDASDYRENVKAAFQRIYDFLKDKYGEGGSTDDLLERDKKKRK